MSGRPPRRLQDHRNWRNDRHRGKGDLAHATRSTETVGDVHAAAHDHRRYRRRRQPSCATGRSGQQRHSPCSVIPRLSASRRFATRPSSWSFPAPRGRPKWPLQLPVFRLAHAKTTKWLARRESTALHKRRSVVAAGRRRKGSAATPGCWALGWNHDSPGPRHRSGLPRHGGADNRRRLPLTRIGQADGEIKAKMSTALPLEATQLSILRRPHFRATTFLVDAC